MSRPTYNGRTVSWSLLCHTATEPLLPRLTALKTSNSVMDETAMLTSLPSICYLAFELPGTIPTGADREGCSLLYCSSLGTFEAVLCAQEFLCKPTGPLLSVGQLLHLDRSCMHLAKHHQHLP